MRKYILIFSMFFIVQSCTVWEKELTKTGNYETAIKNAIIDFNHSSLSTKNRTFIVGYKEYTSGIIGVSILGDDNKIYIVSGSPVGRMKDQYIEYNGKLFYWYDEQKGRNPSIEKKLSEYNVIEKVDSLTEDMGYTIDDAKKGVNYYFCKNNLSVYEKEITSIAMPREKENNLNCK